jgi:hypothetical protein
MRTGVAEQTEQSQCSVGSTHIVVPQDVYGRCGHDTLHCLMIEKGFPFDPPIFETSRLANRWQLRTRVVGSGWVGKYRLVVQDKPMSVNTNAALRKMSRVCFSSVSGRHGCDIL